VKYTKMYVPAGRNSKSERFRTRNLKECLDGRDIRPIREENSSTRIYERDN